MDLKLYDFRGKYLADIEATNVYRDRQSGGYDVLGFETYYKELEKGYRIVVKTPQLDWQEYIINHIVETHKGLEVECENSFYETYGEYISDRRPTGTPNECLDVALGYSRWEQLPKTQFKEQIHCSFYRCSVREAVSQIIEKTGLTIRTSVTIAGNAIASRNVWLDYPDAGNKGYRFEYGFNASNISRTVEDDDVITSLYGFGRGEYIEDTGGYGRRVDFADLNNGLQYVEDPEAVERYGRQIFGKIEFDDTEDREEVLKRTKAELEKRVNPRITYAGSVLDLGFDDTVTIDERVYLIDDILGIEVEGRVLRLVEYLDHSKPNQIELGNFAKVPEAVKQKLDLQEIKEQLATDPTRGGLEAINSKLVDGLLDTLNQKMNEGLLDGKVTYFPGGTIYESENGATYIGHLGWRVANTKNPDGTWDFTTIATGDGLAAGIIGADQILAGTISSDHISAGGIDAGKITVGEAEAKKSLDKALEELNLQDASVTDILSTIQTQMVNRDEFVSAQESYNQAKEAYDKSLLDSQATDEEIQNKLKDLDEARTSYETRVNDLNETIKVYEEALGNVTRSFRTDELGRPVISKPGSNTNLLMDNDGLYIRVAGSSNAYFTKDNMQVQNASIQTLNLGDHQIKVDADGKGFNIVNT